MSLISKYQISEKDLYTLSAIEIQKTNEKFFSMKKEKLKAKSMQILKPYNVKFMDIGNLIAEIRANQFAKDEKLIEKYGEIPMDSINNSYSVTIKILLLILIVGGAIVYSQYAGKLKPEGAIGKTWSGRDTYTALGNIYTAHYTLEIKAKGNNSDQGYSYHLTRDVYENGIFAQSYEFNGDLGVKPEKYETSSATEGYRMLWMFQDRSFGILTNKGNPLNSDGNLEIQQLVNGHVIVLR
ncbi:MAG: hypothetical protein ACKO8Q_02430 [Bacteroidota bacterium]